MGCCFSNDDDKDINGQEPNERTRLLPDMASDDTSASRPMVRNDPSHEPRDDNKNDEQSVLNRILHQTVNDIIDVAALEGQTMDHSEYMDKARQYNVRLSLACAKVSPCSNQGLGTTGVAAPQIVLGAQAVSIADIHLIKTAAVQVAKATQEMKVPHKEDLVVPFGVP